MRKYIYHSLRGIALSDKEEISPGPQNGKWADLPSELVAEYHRVLVLQASVQAKLRAIFEGEMPPGVPENAVDASEQGKRREGLCVIGDNEEGELGRCPDKATCEVRVIYLSEPIGNWGFACTGHADGLQGLVEDISSPEWTVERRPLPSAP